MKQVYIITSEAIAQAWNSLAALCKEHKIPLRTVQWQITNKGMYNKYGIVIRKGTHHKGNQRGNPNLTRL